MRQLLNVSRVVERGSPRSDSWNLRAFTPERMSRDWNAAINILELGLRTVGHTGTLNASEDIDLCIGEVTPQCKPSRGKRKPKK